MTIENIKNQISDIRQKISSWPNEMIEQTTDKNAILALTDAHFSTIETDLQKLITQCKMLPVNEQSVITDSLSELKKFIEGKFVQTEKELIELKNQMNQGRHHFKAIKAYTKA